MRCIFAAIAGLVLLVGPMQAQSFVGKPPLRQAATRSFVNQGYETSPNFVPVMAVSAHYVPNGVTSLIFVFQNFYVDVNNNEVGVGAAATSFPDNTITASVEYPPGTCKQIKFSASANGDFGGNPLLLSDEVTVSVPAGSWIKVREYRNGSSGVPVAGFGPVLASQGDATHAGAGTTDQTVTCDSVTDNLAGTTVLTPLAILARNVRPSVCIIGDSIGAGWDGTSKNIANSVGDPGTVSQSIGPTYGYINLSVGGTRASQYVGHSVVRQAVYSYCSNLISEYGINDILNGATVAALEANLTTIYSLFSGTKFQTTLTPNTTSTDAWATLANQTVASHETNRLQFNSDLRAATFGPAGGYFDLESALGTNSGGIKWKAGAGFPACSPWTPDGLHPSACGYNSVPGNGAISTGRLQ